MTLLNCRRWCGVWLLLIGLQPAATLAQNEGRQSLRFESVEPKAAGIDFTHTDGQSGSHYITETVVGGLASIDFDLDGLDDLYFVNAASLDGNRVASNALYHNRGNWQFSNATAAATVGDTSCGMGVTVADYNGDGFPDLLISNYGFPVLYANQGDGTFSDVTRRAGVHKPNFGAGSAFFDADGDGDLDLYLANYVEFQKQTHKIRNIAGYEFSVGPNDYPPAQDLFYKNNDDGTFQDASTDSGVAQDSAAGMGVLAADFDDDGDLDVFVCNDQMPNRLLINDGAGNFVDDALLAGVALDLSGRPNGNMGIEIADLDQDGLLDLVTTTYQEEMPVVYQALQEGVYADRTQATGLSRDLFNHVTWGVIAADFDLDNKCDVFLATGHFLKNLQYIDDRTTVRLNNYLYLNRGGLKFQDASGQALPSDVRSSRGAVAEDFDRDGDLDIVVLNANDTPSLLKNCVSFEQRQIWEVHIVGTRSNRDAIGSSVEAFHGDASMGKWIRASSRGYESSFGKRFQIPAHASEPVLVRIKWPTGEVEQFQIRSDTILIEGLGDPE